MPRSRKNDEFRMRPTLLPGAHAVEAQSSHAFARHSHDAHGIGLVLAGGQKSASGRGQVEALAGDIVAVNPGEVHDGIPVGGTPRAWCMLYLPPPLVRAAAADLADGASADGDYAFVHPVARHAALAQRFRRLYAAVTTGGTGDAAAMSCEQSLLDLLQGMGDWTARDRTAGVSAAIARARAMIDDAPATAFSLADLASAASLSRFQLVRQFVRATGLTPHAYLIQRRIDTARTLLAGGAALADAAAASGFADQSHMTRLFVRAYGMTPGAYVAALA